MAAGSASATGLACGCGFPLLFTVAPAGNHRGFASYICQMHGDLCTNATTGCAKCSCFLFVWLVLGDENEELR